MKITQEQFESYLKNIPPVTWAWIWGELKDAQAKSAVHKFLFDETDSLRDLTKPWMRAEFDEIIAKYSEVKVVAFQAATNFYLRHSWHRWLPWNWGK